MGKDFIHNWPFQNIFSCVAKTVTSSEKLVKECNSIVPHDRSGTVNECHQCEGIWFGTNTARYSDLYSEGVLVLLVDVCSYVYINHVCCLRLSCLYN